MSGKRTSKPASGKFMRADQVSGIAARRLAVTYIRAVLVDNRVLDDVIDRQMRDEEVLQMEQRDRALARLIAATVLRRRGQIDAVLRSLMAKPLDARKGKIWAILQSAAAQLLFLDTPPHAAINIAVEQCRADRGAHRFAGLANAVLRKVAAKGRDVIAAQDAQKLNTPDWLWQRWLAAYGEDLTRQIAAANACEAALDITLKDGRSSEALHRWAERLKGKELPTGSIRVANDGPIEDLAGFHDGAWWVQDAAAALPAKLLGDVAGKRVADLCAAPGGKTAQLASVGAKVTAVDSSAARMKRLHENLARLQLEAEVVEADATQWQPKEPFDAVLIDAPCTATGTMRRHPDIAHLKKPEDVARLAAIQTRLLDNAITMLRPNGVLVFCTCSLEPEEGVLQINALLQRRPELARSPIRPEEIGGHHDWITDDGDLRTMPFHSNGVGNSGMDGFFAARVLVGA